MADRPFIERDGVLNFRPEYCFRHIILSHSVEIETAPKRVILGAERKGQWQPGLPPTYLKD